jgi:hypothetical protein
MWKADGFSDAALAAIRMVAGENGCQMDEKHVEGRNENYYVVHIGGGRPIDVYVYEDSAGVMRGGEKWNPYEAPDYKSQEELIAALKADVEMALVEGL